MSGWKLLGPDPAPPRRPGFGTVGDKCQLTANVFLVQLRDQLYSYTVEIEPKVKGKEFEDAFMVEMMRQCQRSNLGDCLPVYDGKGRLYTVKPFPFEEKQFKVTVFDEEEDVSRVARSMVFAVKIKLDGPSELSLHGETGSMRQLSPHTLHALDLLLKQRYITARGPLFPFSIPQQRIGKGLQVSRGFRKSLCFKQMGLALTIDMCSTTVIDALPVIEFISQLLGPDVILKPLSKEDRKKIANALKGVKVEVTHRQNIKQQHRVVDVTSETAEELRFLVGTEMKSVVEYLKETYNFTVQYPYLPCLNVCDKKKTFLPLEVCKIVEGQKHAGRLGDKQVRSLLKHSCQSPETLKEEILQVAEQSTSEKDELGEFMKCTMVLVSARILPAPSLKFNETGVEKHCQPQFGRWNMANKRFVDGCKVRYWACINFSAGINDHTLMTFCEKLRQKCLRHGMEFSEEPILPICLASPENVRQTLKHMYKEAMTLPGEIQLDLLLVILPEKDDLLHGEVKLMCETELGVISQCLVKENVLKMDSKYLTSVSLKLNAKLGGSNTVVREPMLEDAPTIILGADVTHPEPGDTTSPSIAAVVGSLDWPCFTKYAGRARAQSRCQELIEEMYTTASDSQPEPGGMIRELLLSFYSAMGHKPMRIIIYRDGVSNGQYKQVLLHELTAIRQACESLEPYYQPPVTFIVVQKRHHTRLFANDHNDSSTTDMSGNVLPGTVVDTAICHPTEFDFYLSSHSGSQGTVRPVHYHILWDENDYSADELQTLSYNLCHTYALCTHSVSMVAPVLYAHRMAYHARLLVEGESSEEDETGKVKPLREVKESLKMMFFC